MLSSLIDVLFTVEVLPFFNSLFLASLPRSQDLVQGLAVRD